MDVSLLVVSALHARGTSLAEAAKCPIAPLPLNGVIKFDMRLTTGELAQLDALAETIKLALGLARPSRSATVALLLDRSDGQ